MRIAIDLINGDRHTIADQLKRVPELVLVPDPETAFGVITDDPTRTEQHVGQGRYVLLLSPFRPFERLWDSINASGRVMPARLGRFAPAVQQLKHELNAGHLGTPGLLRVHDWDGSSQIDDQRLAEALDLVACLFDHPPVVVYAVKRNDYVQIHLGFQDNGMALLIIDANQALASPYRSLHFIGSRGAAYADDHHNMQLAIDAYGTSAILTTEGHVAWANLLRTFAQTMRSRESQHHVWHEIALVRQWVAAVGRSIDRQAPIKTEVRDE